MRCVESVRLNHMRVPANHTPRQPTRCFHAISASLSFPFWTIQSGQLFLAAILAAIIHVRCICPFNETMATARMAPCVLLGLGRGVVYEQVPLNGMCNCPLRLHRPDVICGTISAHQFYRCGLVVVRAIRIHPQFDNGRSERPCWSSRSQGSSSFCFLFSSLRTLFTTIMKKRCEQSRILGPG